MIEVTCDMCKKPIDYNIDGVNLNFNHYGVVKFNNNFDIERQLCIACATRINKWIDEQCEINVEKIVNSTNVEKIVNSTNEK